MYSTTINTNITSNINVLYKVSNHSQKPPQAIQRVTTFNDELFLAKCSTSRKWGRLVCAKWEAVIQRGEKMPL